MDEILEPADHEELSKKIESSEFANDLILRTKDTMRRLRLSAPQLVGTGIGLDPNTVAEYLDNVLPPDSVADLERICLESDVHLAEVASCHHVLTMVLGEPAEVDPAARERMYGIPRESESRHQPQIEAAHPVVELERATTSYAPLPPDFATMAAPIAAPRTKDIPDYLRASVWSRYRVPLVALAAVLVLGVAYLLTSGLKGWQKDSAQVGANTPDNGSMAQQAAPVDMSLPEPTAPPMTNDHASNVARTDAGDSRGPGGTTSTDPYTVASQTAQSIGGPPPLLNPGMSSSPTTAPPAAANATPANDSDRYASKPGADVAATPLPPQSTPMPPTTTETATPPVEAVASSAPMGTDAANPANSLTIPGDHPIPTAAVAAAAVPASLTKTGDLAVELGSYLDGKEILLRNDPQTGDWFRMPPRSSIHGKDRLVALPAFHPRVILSSGVQLKLCGGTEVVLGAVGKVAKEDIASHRAVPEVDVVYGRVVLTNTANAENTVQLKIGETIAQVRLVQNAALALEVLRSYVPGLDPRQSPAPVVAHLYAPDGDVVWTVGGNEQTIHAPQQWDIVNGAVSPVTAATTFPDWIDHEPTEQRTEQLYGAPVVEQTLDTKRPVEDQLLELFQTSHKREVKSLVARSSIYVGLFVPFVEALRDSDQRATWKMHIDTLRSAMALGPDAANKIWETLKEQRGEPTAHDLYEMLCGYNPEQVGRTSEQIADGPVSRLIDWLEKDDLDYRVLAVEDLGEITGKHLLQHPDANPTERAKGVRLWRERLKAGEVMPVAGQ
jgi:hypothetical protein